MDKAESTWVWVWLWKSYTSVLTRSLLLLQTAPRSQGRGWIPGGICTVLLEQKTPQTIALSWKICNFKWQIGKLRESVRIISLRTRKRTRNRIANCLTSISRLEKGLASKAPDFPARAVIADIEVDGAWDASQCYPSGRASLSKCFPCCAGKENEVDPADPGINKTYDTVPDSKLLCTEDGINKKLYWGVTSVCMKNNSR